MHGVLVELALTARGHALLLRVSNVVVREGFVRNRGGRSGISRRSVLMFTPRVKRSSRINAHVIVTEKR